MSANWDESSSEVSRRIGPLKPLNAGGGRKNSARGVRLCAVRVRLCVAACVIPSGSPPRTPQQRVGWSGARRGGG